MTARKTTSVGLPKNIKVDYKRSVIVFSKVQDEFSVNKEFHFTRHNTASFNRALERARDHRRHTYRQWYEMGICTIPGTRFQANNWTTMWRFKTIVPGKFRTIQVSFPIGVYGDHAKLLAERISVIVRIIICKCDKLTFMNKDRAMEGVYDDIKRLRNKIRFQNSTKNVATVGKNAVIAETRQLINELGMSQDIVTIPQEELFMELCEAE